jgi:ubiquinone/menaquinone biosynthesis C-methylase UbiE
VIRRLLWCAAGLAAIVLLLVVVDFPYATDAAPSAEETAKTIAFYQREYAASNDAPDTASADYVKTGEAVASASHVEEKLRQFVHEHGLEDKKVLDIGAGRGFLQDVVGDYTGLDISPTAKRFFRKPFVLGSATALPFQDNHFDAVWSIFVLEHIPAPEQALLEMRRVVKDGGYIYLLPAWSCNSWAANGYQVRPYSDFNLAGKLVKASIPLRDSNSYRALYTTPIRIMRFGVFSLSASPLAFHYNRLVPNYDKYWQGDSDAVSSMDRYEGLLWFASRGDDCLNGRSPLRSISERVSDPRLLIRIHKR